MVTGTRGGWSHCIYIQEAETSADAQFPSFIRPMPTVHEMVAATVRVALLTSMTSSRNILSRCGQR